MTDFDDDEHEGNDNDEAGDDDDDSPETENAAPGASEVSPAPAKRRPRAQPSAVAAVLTAPSGPPSPFGGVPLNATAWGIRKRNDTGGTYGPDLPWNPPGATIALREWPLTELSEQTVRQRWGAGTYQVHWLRTSERGGRDHVSYGREVTILPVVTPPAPAASSPAMPPAAGGLAEALQVLQIIESQADKKIEGMASLARLIAAGNSGGGGLSEAGLSAILESNRTATVEAVRAAVAPLVAGDDDDDTSTAAGAVANAAAPFIKGKGTLATVLNFAQSNPELATKIAGVVVPAVVPAVQSVLTTLLSAFTPPRPPPPPAAVVNPALPRAVPRPVAVPAPPPPPPKDDAPHVVSVTSAFTAPPEAPAPAAAQREA